MVGPPLSQDLCAAPLTRVTPLLAAESTDAFAIGYGDLTSAEILEHVRIAHASHVVVMLNDTDATRRVVRTVRGLASKAPILARAHDLVQRRRLMSAGATDGASQEAEASLQLVEGLLTELGEPRERIVETLNTARASFD